MIFILHAHLVCLHLFPSILQFLPYVWTLYFLILVFILRPVAPFLGLLVRILLQKLLLNCFVGCIGDEYTHTHP